MAVAARVLERGPAVVLGFDLSKITGEQKRMAAVLKAIRLEQGLTQMEVAERWGMSVDGYRPYEAGRRDISISKITGLAAALGVSPFTLLARLGFDQSPEPSSQDDLRAAVQRAFPANAELAVRVYERIKDWHPTNQRAVLENADGLIDVEARRLEHRHIG